MQHSIRLTLRKHHILRLKNDIDRLFDEGKSVKVFPLKLFYRVASSTTANPTTAQTTAQTTDNPLPDKAPLSASVKIMFIVPKRLVKRATERNRTKRRLREAYRVLRRAAEAQFQQRLNAQNDNELHIGVMVQARLDEKISVTSLRDAMQKAFAKIEKALAAQSVNQSVNQAVNQSVSQSVTQTNVSDVPPSSPSP
jgi:ribonuclease P protein component